MRCTKNFVPLAVVALLLVPACAKQPEAGPAPDIAAAPPADAQVHEFTMDEWRDAFCAGGTDWTFDVPTDAWIAMPVSWVAKDEATARANWEGVTYRLTVDGRSLEVPEGLQLRVDSVHFECPNGTIDGIGVSYMTYLPPVTAERHFSVHYLVNDDLNDGWSDYPKGSELTMNLTLRPQGT
ncbi:MAG: hypothetical protein P8099_15955 [Gemmatimonadota bacterium]